jgi:hypothetical protein
MNPNVVLAIATLVIETVLTAIQLIKKQKSRKVEEEPRSTARVERVEEHY